MFVISVVFKVVGLYGSYVSQWIRQLGYWLGDVSIVIQSHCGPVAEVNP